MTLRRSLDNLGFPFDASASAPSSPLSSENVTTDKASFLGFKNSVFKTCGMICP